MSWTPRTRNRTLFSATPIISMFRRVFLPVVGLLLASSAFAQQAPALTSEMVVDSAATETVTEGALGANAVRVTPRAQAPRLPVDRQAAFVDLAPIEPASIPATQAASWEDRLFVNIILLVAATAVVTIILLDSAE